MSNEKPGVFKITTPATLTYSSLFEPRAFQGKGARHFDATLELSLSHPQIADLKATALAVAKEKWPKREFSDDIKSGKFNLPWADGNALAAKAEAKGKNRDFSKGKLVLVAKTGEEYPPKLSVFEQGEYVDYRDEHRGNAKKAFYPGVQVQAVIRFNAYETPQAEGVNAYLQWVISGNRGEKLSIGGKSAAEEFSGYAGVFSDEDPGETVADSPSGF